MEQPPLGLAVVVVPQTTLDQELVDLAAAATEVLLAL
jgi:hypothetical protein